MGKPSKDDVLPGQTLFIVGDDVVFAVDLHIAHGFALYAQGREHLLALVGGHVGIGRAVEQEYGGLDFVGVEEWRLLDVEVWVVPGVTAVLRRFAIGVAPVAAAPIAGDVGDAGVRDGGGEDVRARLQVLRHETAIAGSTASHLLRIYKGMFLAEPLGSFDDLIGCACSPSVDMAGGKLLPEAGRTAGIEDINHITHGGIEMAGEAHL